MEFNTPTNVQEMLDTLADIYRHYRYKQIEFERVELKPLELWRMDDKEKTEEELIHIASSMLKSKHVREIKESKREFEDEITLQKRERLSLEESLKEELEKIDNEFFALLEKAKSTAHKNGVINSEMQTVLTCNLNEQKLRKKRKIEQEYKQKLDIVDEKIKILKDRREKVEEYFLDIHTAEINAKVVELKKEEDARVVKALQYNSEVDKKEQEYENRILEVNARLKLNFLDIDMKDFGKEELVSMGYYKDAISCVYSYLNTLTAHGAYTVFDSLPELVYYLDHYYDSIHQVYMMKSLNEAT